MSKENSPENSDITPELIIKAALILSDHKDQSPHIVIAKGDILDDFWMDYIYKNVINPAVENMPCPLPGVPAEERNFRFQVGAEGLKDKFTYYAFADKALADETARVLKRDGQKPYRLTL